MTDRKSQGEAQGEPTVESENIEERIAARRLRISKRREAEARKAQGADPKENEKQTKPETISSKQIKASRTRLKKLVEDGNQLVTNIAIAVNCREQLRRREEDEANQQRQDRLDTEAKVGQEKFVEITKKWESALSKEVPQDLYDMLIAQKNQCDTMIQEKNKTIEDFTTDLKVRSDDYVSDLRRQWDDIEILVERMEDQSRSMMNAYKQELVTIEASFLTQRSELLTNFREQWETRMKQRQEKEEEYMKSRDERVGYYEKELQALRLKEAEEYNRLKRQLDHEVMILEQQYQQMKATYQLNQEKLDYNFEVLKERNSENSQTTNEQKRRLTKLQDMLNNLRIKQRNSEKSQWSEINHITSDYHKVVSQLRHLQRKSKHFLLNDEDKFRQLWLMNEQEAQALANRLLDLDRVLVEQQLGFDVSELQGDTDLTFLTNTGPLNDISEQQEGGRPAKTAASEVITKLFTENPSDERSEEGQSDDEEAVIEAAIADTKLSDGTVRRILEMISKETGFLLEEKLNALIAPLDPDEQNLMRLDSMFAALGIQTEEDITRLSRYFVNFQRIEEEEIEQNKEGDADQPSTAAESQREDHKSGSFKESPTGTSMREGSALIASQERRSEESNSRDHGEGQGESRGEIGGSSGRHTGIEEEEEEATPPKFLPVMIHSNDVLSALGRFVVDYDLSGRAIKLRKARIAAGREKATPDGDEETAFKIAQLNPRDSSDDAAYWTNYKTQIITGDKQKLWEGLGYALDKYYTCLTARASRLHENQGLSRQNQELRLLLHQYVTSNVNRELQVPPTQLAAFSQAAAQLGNHRIEP